VIPRYIQEPDGMTKLCPRCGGYFRFEEFSQRKAGKIGSYCLRCAALYCRAIRAKKKERRKSNATR
jgi:hypothetical protein